MSQDFAGKHFSNISWQIYVYVFEFQAWLKPVLILEKEIEEVNKV